MVITSFTEGIQKLHISNQNRMQRHGNLCYDLGHSNVANFKNDRMRRHGIYLGIHGRMCILRVLSLSIALIQ